MSLHELRGNPANSDVAQHFVLEPAGHLTLESKPEEADQSKHGVSSFWPSCIELDSQTGNRA